LVRRRFKIREKEKGGEKRRVLVHRTEVVDDNVVRASIGPCSPLYMTHVNDGEYGGEEGYERHLP